jgi:hypothetical protein
MKGCRVPPNHVLERRKKKKPTKHRLQTGTTKVANINIYQRTVC